MEALVLLGPPGAGKGTAAAALSARSDLQHVSTGELFRQAMRDRSAIGEAIRPYMDQGHLVPDPWVMEIITDRIEGIAAAARMLFDGFPRTLPQAEAFDRILAARSSRVTDVLLLVADRNVLVDRLGGRQICLDCRTIYHTRTRPPAVAGVCDSCGVSLAQRGDDNETAIQRRLESYERLTAPLATYYERQGILRHIDANTPKDEVLNAILRYVNRPREDA